MKALDSPKDLKYQTFSLSGYIVFKKVGKCMDVRFKFVKFVLGAVSQEVRDKGYEKLHCAEM